MGTQAVTLKYAPLPRYASVHWIALSVAVTVTAGLAATSALFVYEHFYGERTAGRGSPALSIREQAGQIQIAWSRAAARRGATLEIIDGERRTTLPIAAPLIDVTYDARTADIEVRLTPADGESQPEIARYVENDSSLAELKARFATLLAEARSLQALIERENRRVSEMQTSATDLANRVLRPKPAHAPVAQKATWWR